MYVLFALPVSRLHSWRAEPAITGTLERQGNPKGVWFTGHGCQVLRLAASLAQSALSIRHVREVVKAEAGHSRPGRYLL